MMAMHIRLVACLALLALPLTSSSPAGSSPSAAVRKKRRTVPKAQPPPEPVPIEEEEDVDDEEEDDFEEEEAPPPPPPPPRKVAASKSKKSAGKKSKRRAPPPPPPSMLGSLSSSIESLRSSAVSQVEGVKATLAAREEARQVEAARAHSAHATRLRQLREEMAELQAQVGEDGGDADEEVVVDMPLSLSERGALLGSVLLSPAGVPGVFVGGAFGGAAGYVTERIEQARAYIHGAYNERVETEKRNHEAMQSTHAELKALDEVRVRASDPEEAEALTQAMVAFLLEPVNRKCADCAAPFNAYNDAWASLNQRILVCVNCAAVHRSMGTNVSRIKSVVFDRWDAEMASTLLEGGNQRARDMYLARLPRGYAEPTPDADSERRASFIRTKYVRLKWASNELRESRKGEIAQRRVRAATASASKPNRKGGPTRPLRTGAMPSLSSEVA